MAGFTKLFNSILYSTIWQEPNETRLLWITMLAMSDARGEVQASIPGLARLAGISLVECEAGLATLLEPDTYSRTKEHDGRRIDEIAGGWRLLNHGRYRELLSADERREYNRKKQAEYRESRKTDVNDTNTHVNDNVENAHISEVRSQKSEAEVFTEEENTSDLDYPLNRKDFLKLLWDTFGKTSRTRSSMKQVEDEWKRVNPKPSMNRILYMASKWANCHEWTKDGGQYAIGVHRWINRRKWEESPSEAPLTRGNHAGITQPELTENGF